MRLLKEGFKFRIMRGVELVGEEFSNIHERIEFIEGNEDRKEKESKDIESSKKKNREKEEEKGR